MDNKKERPSVWKAILIALMSVTNFLVFFGAGFDYGVKPTSILDSVSAQTQISIVGGIIYLVICLSMTFLGLALLIATPNGIVVDIFKRDSLVIQIIKPLLIGLTFGVAYQSLIQLLSVIMTLSAISK